MKAKTSLADLKNQKKIVLSMFIIDIVTIFPVLTVSILSNSLVLFADIFDYAFSITSSVIALHVIKKCIKNEGGYYDFGYGKLENLSALITSLLMLFGLALVCYESIRRLSESVTLDPTFVLVGIAFQAIGLSINLYFWLKSLRIGKNGHFPIIEAQGQVNKTNVIGNASVILSLTLGLVFQDSKWSTFIDPLFSIVLVVFTSYSFIKMIRSSLADLLDHTLEEELQMKILRRLAEYESGYERFYEVRSRRSGSMIFIDITLGFEPMRTIGDALDVSARIKEHLETDIPNCEVNVIIHSIEEYLETVPGLNTKLIVPMSEKYIEDCIDLIKEVFPNDDLNLIKYELVASYSPNSYRKELEKHNISKPRYWVAVENGKAVGFTGLHYKIDEPDAVWGGWLALKPAIANSLTKLKLQLIWKVVFEARHTGRKYFKIMTTDAPEEYAANKLYDSVGLYVVGTEMIGDLLIKYRQAEIAWLYNVNRPGVKTKFKQPSA